MRSMVRGKSREDRGTDLYPLFVMEGENIVQPVESMPGICQYSVDRMNEELDRERLQIPAILIFGIEHKDEVGGAGLMMSTALYRPRSAGSKKDYPDLLVIADVCLCEYTSHGHCG